MTNEEQLPAIDKLIDTLLKEIGTHIPNEVMGDVRMARIGNLYLHSIKNLEKTTYVRQVQRIVPGQPCPNIIYLSNNGKPMGGYEFEDECPDLEKYNRRHPPTPIGIKYIGSPPPYR